MNREFYWQSEGENYAVLCGPERHMIAAVVTLEKFDPETYGFWRVMSPSYSSLNRVEDMRLPLAQIKRRVLVDLGNELAEMRQKADEDITSVIGLLEEQEME